MGESGRVQFFLAALVIAVMAACSSEPRATQARKSEATLDKIQGKIEVLPQGSGSADARLNEGLPVVYLWEGVRRYTLYFRKPLDVVNGKEYLVEGIDAQKAIEEIGDPDAGKSGYPLLSSCERVVRTAWSGLSFDETDGRASALRGRVKRYPARPVFLVMRIEPAASGASTASAKGAGAEEKDENVAEVAVPAEKQRASRIAGPTALTAPLWEPAGGTVLCPVVIDTNGKISELGTGMQLCEAVPWSEFRYQPLMQAGQAVKVKTEVEVNFKPRT